MARVLVFVLIPIASLSVALAPPRLTKRPLPSRSITDMAGRVVALWPPANRVALYPPLLPDYLAIDDGPLHVLMVAPYQLKDVSAGLLGKVYPAAKKIAAAATRGNDATPADPEELLLMKPDAVFLWDWYADALDRVGLPVVRMTVDSRDGEKSDRDRWRVIAAVAGKSRRGAALLAQSDRESAAVARVVANLDTKKRPRAAVMSIYGLGDMRAAVGDYIIPRALRLAGGVNAAAGLGHGPVDVEALLRLDPAVIFLNWRWNSFTTPGDLYDTPALQSLAAVRNRRIYIMPQGGSIMDTVIELPLLAQWMAELLHPAAMPRLFRKKLEEGYRETYHYALTDDEIDDILYLRENRASTSFARFARAGEAR